MIYEFRLWFQIHHGQNSRKTSQSLGLTSKTPSIPFKIRILEGAKVSDRVRALIENVSSSVERKLSARARNRVLRMQMRQALLLWLGFNLVLYEMSLLFLRISPMPNRCLKFDPNAHSVRNPVVSLSVSEQTTGMEIRPLSLDSPISRSYSSKYCWATRSIEKYRSTTR